MGEDVLLGLLRACKAAPDDDAPRLVLADWLEEHGDPERAEFIRLQCTPALDADRRPTPGWEERRRREQELWSRNYVAWVGRLAKAILPGQDAHSYVRSQRGFLSAWFDSPYELPDDVSAQELAWMETLALQESPFLSFTLLPPPKSLYWPELVALTLSGGSAFDGYGVVNTFLQSYLLASLTALRELPSLRKLSLVQHEFEPEDMAALVAAPWFGQLTHLDVRSGSPASGLALCRELASPGAASSLRSLRITLHELGDESLRLLARAALLGHLTSLDLTGNEAITDGGIAALAASPGLRSVTELSLGGPSPISDRDIATLVQSPYVSNLRYLWLESDNITDEGAGYLARSGSLGALERLALPGTQVSEAGAVELSNSPKLPRLRVLDLGGSAFEGAIERSAVPEVTEERPDGVWLRKAIPRQIGRVRVSFYRRSLSALDQA
jgi:uncharacterized protein (TIGR02996 family)